MLKSYSLLFLFLCGIMRSITNAIIEPEFSLDSAIRNKVTYLEKNSCCYLFIYKISCKISYCIPT